MGQSENVLTKIEDLLMYALPLLDKFPRSQKFILGDRIERKLTVHGLFCRRAPAPARAGVVE